MYVTWCCCIGYLQATENQLTVSDWSILLSYLKVCGTLSVGHAGTEYTLHEGSAATAKSDLAGPRLKSNVQLGEVLNERARMGTGPKKYVNTRLASAFRFRNRDKLLLLVNRQVSLHTLHPRRTPQVNFFFVFPFFEFLPLLRLKWCDF